MSDNPFSAVIVDDLPFTVGGSNTPFSVDIAVSNPFTTASDTPVANSTLGGQIVVVPGPPGPVGPTGATGPTPADFKYVHDQNVPAYTWTVHHNLGGYPSITVLATGIGVVSGDISYVDQNTVVFASAVLLSGKAFLS